VKIEMIQVTDDIDGEPDASTYTFGYNGTMYEIDLSETHSVQLQEFLAPFVAAGRRLQNGNGKAKTPRQRRGGPGSPAEIRQWWLDNPDGLPGWSSRGAIPAHVLRAWEQRHQQPQPPEPEPEPEPELPAEDGPAPVKRARPRKRQPADA